LSDSYVIRWLNLCITRLTIEKKVVAMYVNFIMLLIINSPLVFCNICL